MNQEIKKLWVNALHSGDYKQGAKYLRDSTNQYCPLGVLCDIHRTYSLGKRDWVRKGDRYDYISHHAVLPATVRRWAGLNKINPLFLAQISDIGIPFVEIAKLIEAEL